MVLEYFCTVTKRSRNSVEIASKETQTGRYREGKKDSEETKKRIARRMGPALTLTRRACGENV